MANSPTDDQTGFRDIDIANLSPTEALGGAEATENEQLCWKCQGLLRAECSGGFVEEESEDDFDEMQTQVRRIRACEGPQGTSKDGCRLCRLYVHSMYGSWEQGILKGATPVDIELSQEEAAFNPAIKISETAGTGGDRSTASATLDLYTASDFDPHVSHNLLEPSTDSPATWSLVGDWLRHCDSEHDCWTTASGNDSRPLPSRILDVTPGQAIQLKITATEVKPGARYATLSHCWGSHMPLRLLSSNIEQLRRDIPWSQLTKTFQDAITTCRRMDVSYLWIDSLCIIQDSAEDWRVQSATMANVYSNGYCNIFAAHAKDGTHGCFSSRDPHVVKPVRVQLDWGPAAGAHYVVLEKSWRDIIFDSPLNGRAWVFQERTLAPRNLIFGASEVAFECRRGVTSEQYPTGVPRRLGAPYAFRGVRPDVDGRRLNPDRPPGGAGALDGGPGLDAFYLWNVMVVRYSGARLTFQTDRLVALSAVASEMHKHIRSPYLAGLWRRHLPYQLLWEPNHSYGENERPSTYIAPSWSWAWTKTPVENVCSVAYADERDIVVAVLEATITPVSLQAPFGQVLEGGHLRLRGHLARGTPVSHSLASGAVVLRLPFTAASGGELNNWVHFDVPTTAGDVAGRPFCFLPVRLVPAGKGRTSYVHGLILRQVGSPGEPQYERVGTFKEYEDLRGSSQRAGSSPREELAEARRKVNPADGVRDMCSPSSSVPRSRVMNG